MSHQRYRWRLLDAGPLLLDGGGMFGVIPKVVWSRTVECDELNRIKIRHNCLLLESESADPALGRPRHVVFETGTGDKLNEKMSKIFGLSGRTVETAIAEAGARTDTIDDVFVTHLHFDHAGGLTRRPREGETPDWTAPDARSASGESMGVVRTFPNATVHSQGLEWATAQANNSVMTRTYYRDHLEPIAGQMRLAEAPLPMPHDRIPNHSELPRSPLEDRWVEPVPGVRCFSVPGHTWGQQAMLFTDDQGREICFVPDVMPTAWHVGKTYSLSYDVEPYTSMVSRHWLLHEAVERDWLLVLPHDPNTAVVRARREGDWFALEPVDA